MPRTSDLSFLDYFAVSFVSNIFEQPSYKSLLDLGIQNNMVLKLAHLHVFNGLKLHFWNVVFVHVE